MFKYIIFLPTSASCHQFSVRSLNKVLIIYVKALFSILYVIIVIFSSFLHWHVVTIHCVSKNRACILYMPHNSCRYGPILIILSLRHSWMNWMNCRKVDIRFTTSPEMCRRTTSKKIECSTALLFIPISQNNVHIRLIVRMINWEVFLFNGIYL